MKPRLSVCITACDEENELSRCLEAVASAGIADEVVVLVDEKSSDATLDVARAHADRVATHAYDGDVAQKRRCAAMASGEWLLVIDPDEVVTEELGASIRDVAAEGASAPCAGYRVDRVTHHLGRWIRHGDFYPDWTLRLARRDRWRYEGEDPHGRIAVDGRVGRLRGELHHFSYRDLADQIDRIQFFSGQAASAMFDRGRRSRWSDLLLRPPLRFIRALFLRRGVLDGRAGFVIASATAFHVFLKYAKLWELERRAGRSVRAER